MSKLDFGLVFDFLWIFRKFKIFCASNLVKSNSKNQIPGLFLKIHLKIQK